ncbi:MAG TPA: aspartyl/asparaginyl beta-hydroxylase domain-containing protein [Blastocatellia bacterium]|nr:aspartyl/asparaginyl beta-hydroxylase domain-containing protein [Blastocatellia bacterium]
MFIDLRQFEFVAYLESNWRVIRDEYLALPENVFEPWVQREMYGEGWSVYGLHAFGKRIEPALATCPKTAFHLSKIPNLTTAGFSRLAPQTHIKPHVGWVKSVYRLHLGLVIPESCKLRVGNEVRSWVEGKCLVFDDTLEHEAWNNSNQSRAILLLDFLRPGAKDCRSDEMPSEVQQFVEKIAK